MKKITPFIIVIVLIFSCTKVKNKTKETINKGSKTAGEFVSEAVIKIKDGADNNLKCKIIIDSTLNITSGKSTISYDHTLEQYLIYEADISDTLIAKAYDREHLEIGRSKVFVKGKKGEAQYIDFVFDKRTYLENQGVIKIERL